MTSSATSRSRGVRALSVCSEISDWSSASTAPWGGYEDSFADPDGYVWGIGYSAQGEGQPYAEDA